MVEKVFLDFGVMSILLVAAHLLRSRVRLLQHILLPTPIVAGFLGLLLCSLSKRYPGFLPFSESEPGVSSIASYPLINIATRCGWTRMIQSAQELPESVRRGFTSQDKRRSIGEETVSPIALDPLAWHVALVLAAFAIAFFVGRGIKAVFPGDYSVPLFPLSMLAGACIQRSLDMVQLGQYVDKRVMDRIGSSVSDFLIGFGVASIKVGVVVEFAIPIVVLSLFGIAFAAAVFWFVGRRIYHNFWFERSIFVYGWNTGVVAIGITLLRVVDPRLKTKRLVRRIRGQKTQRKAD